MNIKTTFACLLAVVLTLGACGTSKVTTGQGQSVAGADERSEAVRKLSFVQKVSDNKLYQKNIVAKLSFTVQSGDKNITVPGQLRMRKDEVIRLQLQMPLLGSEVGRLEFTPDYVLVVDRIHKEYIKANYNDLDFLRDNGLSFYSLQALFWNQLLLPGARKVSESDLKKFDVNIDETAQNLPVLLRNGNMTYTWTADRTTGRIMRALVSYVSSHHGTSALDWNYSGFTALGSKQFPAKQKFSFTTTATKEKRSVAVVLDMSKVTVDDNWDAQTVVSEKYKKVNPEDVFGKLLNM